MWSKKCLGGSRRVLGVSRTPLKILFYPESFMFLTYLFNGLLNCLLYCLLYCLLKPGRKPWTLGPQPPPWFPLKPSSILNQAGPAQDPVRLGACGQAGPGLVPGPWVPGSYWVVKHDIFKHGIWQNPKIYFKNWKINYATWGQS